MIKYNFIKNKINERYKQFVDHPLVINPWIGLIKYIYLNLRLRLKQKPIVMRWMNNLKYHLSLGDSGVSIVVGSLKRDISLNTLQL